MVVAIPEVSLSQLVYILALKFQRRCGRRIKSAVVIMIACLCSCRRSAWSTCQSLRSAATNLLVVPPFKLSTIDTRAFLVANPCVWNSLPADITSAPSLSTFRQGTKNLSITTIISSSQTHRLKTHCLILCSLSVDLAVTFTWTTLKKTLIELNC